MSCWLWFSGMGLFLRLATLVAPPERLELQWRPETATPVTAANRLAEGVFLKRSGVDPYDGGVFHEPPLVLAAANALTNAEGSTDERVMGILRLAVELVTAVALTLTTSGAAALLRRRQASDAKDRHEDAQELAASEGTLLSAPWLTMAIYLLNPYSILSFASRSTIAVDNLFLAAFLATCVRGRRLPSCFFLALAAYKTLYPAMLIVPLCLAVHQQANEDRKQQSSLFVSSAVTVTVFSAFFSSLVWFSGHFIMEGNWSFLASTYGFVLSVPELTPNMGLFWYFFTEMFEHFRLFFVCTFQLNTLAYVAPLTVRLRRQPFLLAFSLVALTAIFKSYPSYGDVGLYLSLLPAVGYLLPYTRQILIVGCMLLATTSLGPVVHYLWVYAGSANANYFFAINLVFGTAQIFLVTDLLFANIRREFYLQHGFKWLRENANRPDGPRLLFI